MIVLGNFVGSIGSGGLFNPKITVGTKTATTIQLIWKGGIPTSLEQSADGGITWTPAVNTGLTATGTKVTGLNADTDYQFRATFIPTGTATDSTLSYTTDAQGEVWVINGTAITQNSALKKLDGTDITATINYTDVDGENNLKGFPGYWNNVSNEQGSTTQGIGHYQRVDGNQDARLMEIIFDKDVKISHYFIAPRPDSTVTRDRAKDMGFILYDANNNQVGIINKPLTPSAWTPSGTDIENVRKVHFVIFKNPNTGDAYEQFNYINLRVR